MFSAFADEAGQAVSQTTAANQMDYTIIVFIVLGAYSIFCGVASLLTRKVYGMGKSAQEFTDDSLKAYSPYWGVGELLVGIGVILLEVLDQELFKLGSFSIKLGFVFLILLAVMGIAAIMCGRKKLVKKR